MAPLLIFAQRCRGCGRRWVVITTPVKRDAVCWWCGSTDVHIVGSDPPDDDAS